MPIASSDRVPAAPEVRRTRRWNQVVFQMVSLWGAFTGLLAVAAPCPCCGRMGCPVGLGLFAVAGGMLAFCVRGRNLITRAVRRVRRRWPNREDGN